jgi:hypothetical protein
MTFVWTALGVVLVVGIGLVAWGARPVSPPVEDATSRRRTVQTQVGAVLVVASLGAFVVAYLTAPWP